MSVIVETFETACTWDRFEELHAAVTAAADAAVTEVCGAGMVTCRFTHVYPDGPAPYFSVYAPGRPGSEVAMWDDIKAAVSEALADHGGTITHHHAVGRDHDAVPPPASGRPRPHAPRRQGGGGSAPHPQPRGHRLTPRAPQGRFGVRPGSGTG